MRAKAQTNRMPFNYHHSNRHGHGNTELYTQVIFGLFIIVVCVHINFNYYHHLNWHGHGNTELQSQFLWINRQSNSYFNSSPKISYCDEVSL